MSGAQPTPAHSSPGALQRSAKAGRRERKGRNHFASRNLMLAHNALVVARPTSKRESASKPRGLALSL